jgi:hypothetical protein
MILILWTANWKAQDSPRMIASIPCLPSASNFILLEAVRNILYMQRESVVAFP